MNAPERIMPTGFEVSLPVTPDVVVKLKLADGALATAQSYEIDSNEMAQIVATQRNDYLKNITTLKELKKGFVAPAKAIIANAEALFDPALEELDASVKHLNAGLLSWDQKEKARIALEKSEREAAERKARQDADRAAAVERARAQAEADEQRRKAREAEEAHRKAQEEGNARAMATAKAAQARALELANAAVENGNAKAQGVIMQAAAVTAAAPTAEPVKIAGNSFRENWIAEFKPGNDESAVKREIALVLAERPELIVLFDLNLGQCNKMAKTYKELTSIPGMTARNAPITAGSRK